MDLLTKNAIPRISKGEIIENVCLQVIQMKKIPGSSQERYRFLVSDGDNVSSFAMLAAQLNNKVRDNEIAPHCIIKLNKYICNTVHSAKKVLVILDLDIVKTGSEIGQVLGSPVTYDINKAGQAEAPAAAATTNTTTSATGTRSPLVQRNLPNSITSSVSRTPGGSTRNAQPISSLTPYSNKWTICARVTSKSAVKTWSNSRGEGKLFSMDLLDESGEIRATAFKDQCDAFYDMIQVDKVYYISSATLKAANKQFSKLKNDYELTFNASTQVEPCHEETNIPTIQFEFVSIDQLESLNKDTIVDVIGIVKEVGDVVTLTAKSSGKELKKRELQLVDQSSKQVQLALWGQQAETFDASSQPVLAVKGAKISEFNGINLSTIFSSTLQINPDIPEAHKLKGWFESVGSNLTTVSLSNQRSGSGGVGANLKTFAEAKLENLGASESNTDYYSQKASITLIRKENCMYESCPSEGCSKKVIDMNNGFYRCEKCNREYDSFNYRLLLSANLADGTDNQWVTAFQDSAETILGISAQELGALRENNSDAFQQIFTDATFKEFLFKFRVKMETYNDESRLKTTIVAVSPFDAKEYNKILIREIKEMTQN